MRDDQQEFLMLLCVRATIIAEDAHSAAVEGQSLEAGFGTYREIASVLRRAQAEFGAIAQLIETELERANKDS